MDLRLDENTSALRKVQPAQLDTYVEFRSTIMKPSAEFAHLQHILRFYIARALSKQGKENIYILPDLWINDQPMAVDIITGSPGKFTIAICEPGSVTPETEAKLEILKNVGGLEVIVVHSQYGHSGNLSEKFSAQIESKKFRILAVVPPPFDDVYEYDIWMFETTFRNIFDEET